MGYSARYHAASLVAVFLALGVGILIGVGFGDSVISGTQRNLESSLKGDLDEAREAADRAREGLDREREFSQLVYPSLVSGRLEGMRVGLVGLGGLPAKLSRDVRDALQPTGATLVEVAAVRVPPDREALARALAGTRFAKASEDDRALGRLGERIGRELMRGERLLIRARKEALARVSGELAGLDGAVLVREPSEDLDEGEARLASRFERAVLLGVAAAGVELVAAERSDSRPSSVELFAEHQISTVDSLDLASGRVALVLALAGAEGNFGIKSTADRLLPELLFSSARRGRGE